jgi:hypothetical protein
MPSSCTCKLIDEGLKDLSFAPVDSEFASLFVLCVMNWILIWYQPSGERSRDEIIEAFIAMIENGLRDLEANDLVKRTAYPEFPPRVEYEITPSAKALRPVFDELSKWSEKHGFSLAVELDDLPKRAEE